MDISFAMENIAHVFSYLLHHFLCVLFEHERERKNIAEHTSQSVT